MEQRVFHLRHLCCRHRLAQALGERVETRVGLLLLCGVLAQRAEVCAGLLAQALLVLEAVKVACDPRRVCEVLLGAARLAHQSLDGKLYLLVCGADNVHLHVYRPVRGKGVECLIPDHKRLGLLDGHESS